jgi:hypothetical protein
MKVFGLVGVALLSAGCSPRPDSDLPTVPPSARCEEPWPPSPVAYNIPRNLESAVSRILVCISAHEHAAIRSESESQYTARTHMGLGLAIRDGWLRPERSPLQQDLKNTGFDYPDDMSGAILSGVWHRVYDQRLDLAALASCTKAWNSENERLMRSTPAGTPFGLPGFSCGDDRAIQAGRERWAVTNR